MVSRRLIVSAAGAAVALAVTPAALGQGVLPSVRLQTAIGTGPHLFGDQMEARLDVLVDRSRTDVGSVRVDTNFFPYKRLGTPRRASVRDGDTQRITYSYRLECVTVQCFPGLTKQQFKVSFPYAVVRYRELNGGRRGLAVKWPTFRLLSRLPPLTAAQLRLQAPITTGFSPAAAMFAPVAVPAATYRMSPVLLAVLLLAGALLALAAGAVVGWPVLQHLRSTTQGPEGPTLTSLERALERVEESANAAGRGDREALAWLARELTGAGRPDDARQARRLAWSEHEPTTDDSIALVRRVRDGLGAQA
jgi:hypothetical protein